MKKQTLCFCVIIVLSLTLFGQTEPKLHVVYTQEKSKVHVAPPDTPQALKSIFSDLGPKDNLYRDSAALAILGPNSGFGETVFWAMPFTPKSDAHVSEVRVPIQYNGSGANQVNISLYSDSGSVTPGTLLAGPVTVTNLADFGTCCALAVADFSSLAVTAGTQYWVVVDTPLTGTGSDFNGVWNFTTLPIYPQAESGGGGWSYFSGFAYKPAGQVLGTIP